MFITKLTAFINRKEFKDLYDISHLIPIINIDKFKHNPNVINLIDNLISTILNQDITLLFKNAFRNVDIRFKDLKESEMEKFTSKTVRDLRILKNRLR